jgi:proton-translocating NAD(P)+ transhydrogenase subunit alpha
MKIGVVKERIPGEKRVAITPAIVAKLVERGIDVCIEKGAGESALFNDKEYEKSGAKISKIPLEILADANIVLKVQPSNPSVSAKNFDELKFLADGAIIVGLLSPFTNTNLLKKMAKANITSFAMEFVPRITRAQSMDVLSSQSNLAGYKAVLDAAAEYSRVFPMMMTAAGTVHPAKVLVLGAGVAGLQAIATAKRLGAIVSVFDVRPAAKEQVESLGGRFVEVESDEDGAGQGGYAKETSEDYKKKQRRLVHEEVSKSDIVITTALIPGREAPKLVTERMVDDMKPGSVIVDLAAIAGGNCELTVCDKMVNRKGIKIIGHSNMAARLAPVASELYSRNLLNFVNLLISDDNKKIELDLEDEIIKSSLITHRGSIVHKALRG